MFVHTFIDTGAILAVSRLFFSFETYFVGNGETAMSSTVEKILGMNDRGLYCIGWRFPSSSSWWFERESRWSLCA
jgi:hypothetical protein